ncbi:NAC domain-containing protein 82-like [Rutidosis leptorrhynchoides]|uniref:NAC domain-containing protein 82-like n=1 Tax=Rutidosis leptorrhynchoides TaxID=125765 RepID=UPI003A99D972
MAISFPLPGFRFHPTDVELVMYYLKRKLLGKKIVNAVAEVNIYDFSPWDLPGKSSLKNGDLEWFFFCPNLKRFTNGSRCNRATKTGFWKATGKDRKVKYKDRIVGSIKTLVYHILDEGKGKRTDWVMHEYKMDDEQLANAGVVQDMYVLCKVFEKSGAGPKNGAQYGAPYDEEAWNDNGGSCSGSQVTVGPGGTTNSLDYMQKDPATLNMDVSLTKPCSSTVMFSDNEGQMDVVSSDDMILEEIASLLGVSTKNNNGNNDNEGVEATNKKKGKSVVPNEDDIYADLVSLVDLDELKGAELNKFESDGTEYTISKLLSSDDLDMDLRDFYVD